VELKLALDFDGVLSDTIQSWVDHWNKDHKDDLSKDLFTHRDVDMWGFYTKLGITLDECFKYFDKAWGDWKNLQPQERHLTQKTKMLNNLVDVDIVTAVQPEHLEDIRNWLSVHDIRYNKLVHSNDKEKLPYDIYIDDADRNIQKVFEAGKIGLLYNQAWNTDTYNAVADDHSGMITRVYNLYHAIDIVRGIVS